MVDSHQYEYLVWDIRLEFVLSKDLNKYSLYPFMPVNKYLPFFTLDNSKYDNVAHEKLKLFPDIVYLTLLTLLIS